MRAREVIYALQRERVAAHGPLALLYRCSVAPITGDILVLAPTRWKLRQAVKVVNQVLTSLRLAKHPDKTFIGRIARGFDFLGYDFNPEGLRIATKTVANFVARVRQLYDHEPGEGVSARLG